MNFVYTVLYILLFVFCLSTLVLIHELGHFLTAKFFKVYIQEFSIGFGPAFFHRKRKNGETYFSLRAIPFGGYVAMYGEGNTVPEGVENIPPERSFTNIRKWKRIIILFAGVFNNALFALLLFFISNSCFIQKGLYLNYVNVKPGSMAQTAQIEDGSYISLRQYTYMVEEGGKMVEKFTNYYVIDKEASLKLNDAGSPLKPVVVLLQADKITSFNNISYDSFMHFFPRKADGSANLDSEYLGSDMTISEIDFKVTTAKKQFKQYINSAWTAIPDTKILNPKEGEAYYQIINKRIVIYVYQNSSWVESKNYTTSYTEPTNPTSFAIWCDLEAQKTEHNLVVKPTMVDDKRVFESTGLSFLYDEWWNDFGTAVGKTFTDWGNSATVIVRSFISLFTKPETWKDVGGIIAIGVQTSNVLANLGVAKFIYIWGLISVNLAIVNLFPFPGLDGWQILVLVVEGVFRKQIPEKVKNIVSFVGVIVLMAFMALIVVKDVIGLF